MNNLFRPDFRQFTHIFSRIIVVMSFVLLASNTVCNAGGLLGQWQLDENFIAEATLTEGTLSLRLINNGAQARTINAALMDERYIMANVVRMRIRSVGDPRGRIEMFRIFGDGVIGINSEMFPVKPLEIKAGSSLEAKVALASALEQLTLSNESVARWKRSADHSACIILAIAFRDIGVASDAGVELISPWIVVELPQNSSK